MEHYSYTPPERIENREGPPVLKISRFLSFKGFNVHLETVETVEIKKHNHGSTVQERRFRDCVTTSEPNKKWNTRYDCSRVAAQEYSPRRKPWVESGKRISTEGAKERL